MKIFEWPKNDQEDIDPAVLKRFNININDYKNKDENEELIEDLVEDAKSSTDDDDEYVSIEELEEDDEDKYEVHNMKSKAKKPQVSFGIEQKEISQDWSTRTLVDLFKRQMENSRKLSDSEVIENLSKIIIASFRKAKEEFSNSKQKPIDDLLEAVNDYEDPFEEETFEEPGSEDFFFVPKNKKVNHNELQNPVVKSIANLITIYLRKGSIEQLFVKIPDLNQFYYDLNEINLILVASLVDILKKTNTDKTKAYLRALSNAVIEVNKYPKAIDKLKFYLKLVNQWRAKQYPKYSDIAFKTFVDNDKVAKILSRYQLAVLPEEFTKMISCVLNQTIF